MNTADLTDCAEFRFNAVSSAVNYQTERQGRVVGTMVETDALGGAKQLLPDR